MLPDFLPAEAGTLAFDLPQGFLCAIRCWVLGSVKVRKASGFLREFLGTSKIWNDFCKRY